MYVTCRVMPLRNTVNGGVMFVNTEKTEIVVFNQPIRVSPGRVKRLIYVIMV